MALWRVFCVIVIVMRVTYGLDNSNEPQWGHDCSKLPDSKRKYKEIRVGSSVNIRCVISSNCKRGLWRSVIDDHYIPDCEDGKETSKCVETRGKKNIFHISNVSTDDLKVFECRCDHPKVATSNNVIKCFLLQKKTQTNDKKPVRSFSCNQVSKQSQTATENVYVGDNIRIECLHKKVKSDCPFSEDTTTGNFRVEYSPRPCNISCVTPAGVQDCFITFKTSFGPSSSTPHTSYSTRSQESIPSTPLSITSDFPSTKRSPYPVFVILLSILFCTVIATFLLMFLGIYINKSQSKRTQGNYLDLEPNPPELVNNYTLLRQTCYEDPLNSSGPDNNLMFSINGEDQTVVHHEYSYIRANNIVADESKTGYPIPESCPSYVPMDLGSHRNLQRKTGSAEPLNTMALYDNPLNMRHWRSKEVIFAHVHASTTLRSGRSERFVAGSSSREISSLYDVVPLDHRCPGSCTTLHTEVEYEKMTAETSVLPNEEILMSQK